MEHIAAYKGIAPGKIISYFLKDRGLSQKELANRLHCYPQTISAVVCGSREIPEKLAYTLDKEFGFEEGFFFLIQAYYKIKCHSEGAPEETKPVPKIRPAVFWDVDMNKLDWQKNKSFIISRVMERGSESEKDKVRDYYAL